jgi:hypothetical protein
MQSNFQKGIQMSPRRADPRLKKQAQSGMPTWVIAIGIGVLVVVGVVVLFSLQTSVTPAPGSGGGNSTTAASRTKGDSNAKLELIVYSDFQ